jgi:hypothetical protein
MKSTDFRCKRRHAFANCLEDASRGSRGLWETFSDWLECAHLALSQAVQKFQTGDICPEREKQYLEAIHRQREPKKFSEALSILTEGLEFERYDFLGTMAGEAGLLNKWNGQFFTPKELCNMMVRMTFGEATPDPGHRLTIREPCSGAGAMAIAAADYLMAERGFWPRHYWLDCQDIDRRMFQATYIQLTLCGVPAVVRWGNSLSDDPPRSELTLVGAMYPRILTAEERAAADLERTKRSAARARASWLDRQQPARPVRKSPAKNPPPSVPLAGQTELSLF